MINFSDLKRNKIRKIIQNGDAPIEIYNPTKEQNEEILEMLISNYNKETRELLITEKQLLKEIIPMLTNIYIDIDDDVIQGIIEDPSDVLLDTQEELSIIVRGVATRYLKAIETMGSLPEEEINKLLEEEFKKKIGNMSETMDVEA